MAKSKKKKDIIDPPLPHDVNEAHDSSLKHTISEKTAAAIENPKFCAISIPPSLKTKSAIETTSTSKNTVVGSHVTLRSGSSDKAPLFTDLQAPISGTRTVFTDDDDSETCGNSVTLGDEDTACSSENRSPNDSSISFPAANDCDILQQVLDSIPVTLVSDAVNVVTQGTETEPKSLSKPTLTDLATGTDSSIANGTAGLTASLETNVTTSFAGVTAANTTGIQPITHSTVLKSVAIDNTVLGIGGISADATAPKPVDTTAPKPVWRSLFANNRKPGQGLKLRKMDGIKGQTRLKMGIEDERMPKNSWEHGLIGYIAGNKLGKGAIINYCNSWKIQYKLYFDINGWIGLKFQNEDDKDHILSMGPHSIFGRPFMLKTIPRYFAFEDEVTKQVPVWVRLPKLPFIYWNDYAISRILTLVGTPLQTDIITEKGDGFTYALGLVEIDVSESLVRMIELELPNGEVIAQKIEYEYVPKYCKTCKMIGHGDCALAHINNKETERVRNEQRNQGKQTGEGTKKGNPKGADLGAETVGGSGAAIRATLTCERCKLRGHLKETCRVNINTCDRCKIKGHSKETCRRTITTPTVIDEGTSMQEEEQAEEGELEKEKTVNVEDLDHSLEDNAEIEPPDHYSDIDLEDFPGINKTKGNKGKSGSKRGKSKEGRKGKEKESRHEEGWVKVVQSSKGLGQLKPKHK